MINLLSKHRAQFAAFAGLWAVLLALTTVGYTADPMLFKRFFGSLNPLIAFTLLCLTGLGCCAFLIRKGWFSILSPGNVRSRLAWLCLAPPLAGAAIVVDRIAPFPADMNVLFPASLVFYPLIGFVAEIVFHLLPVSLLALIAQAFRRTDPMGSGGIIVVGGSLLEPLLQVVLEPSGPGWRMIWVGLHVFAINLIQMLMFRRFDLLSMYAFRLVYYSIWHIGWGYFRLLAP